MDSIIRKHITLLCAIIAFLGSVVATFATQSERDFMLRGVVNPTQNHALPYRMPILGVNAELTQYTPDELSYHLNLIREANIHWVRQLVRWDVIEPSQGEYHWEMWDNLVDAFQDYPELELVLVFVDTPQWATRHPYNPTSQRTAPPDNPHLFANFIGTFVSRYQDTIHFYQIWDEPNIALGWGNLQPNVAHYVAMLQSAYNAIHQNDPSAYVISAGLAPTTETGPINYNEFDFMRMMYAHGAKDYTDAWAGMPYGFEHSPYNRTVDVNYLNASRFVMLREIMIEHGDAHKPLWASAWGWNALPEDWTGRPSIWRDVTPTQQIQYTLDLLKRAEHEWTWLGGMIIYHWQPLAEVDNPLWGFSILNQDDSIKPLYEALKNRVIMAMDGLYPARNPSAHYSGVWTFTDIGADIGWIQDSSAEFRFIGRDVALITREHDAIAHLYITVDDQPANALPRDMAGNSYLSLRSGTLSPTVGVHIVARNLALGEHTLRIVADEIVPDEIQLRYPLVGFAVSSGDLSEPYNRQIFFGWMCIGISSMAFIVTIRAVNILWLWHTIHSAWMRLNEVSQLIIGAMASIALLLAMFLTWQSGVPAIFRRDSVQLGLSILTAGVIYLNPMLVMTIIAISILFILIYHRLELGAILAIFWSPFFLFPVELYRFSFPIAEIIIILTFIATLLRTLAQYGEDNQILPQSMKNGIWKNLNQLDVMMILWLILGMFGVMMATYRALALTDFRVMFAEPVILYGVIRLVSRTKQSLIRLMDALILAGLVVAGIGLVMWLRGQSIITAEDGVKRLASVYGSPNNVGLILGRCIPFALALILIKTDNLRQYFGIISFLVMVLALILTQSAGALFIGVPIGVITVISLSLRQKAILPIIGITSLVVLGGIIASQSPRFERLIDMTSGTNFYRLRAWQSAINIIQDYPITGIGLDQYLYFFRDKYMLPDAWQEPNLSHPHNIILDFWLRLGILGVIWLLILIAIWSKRAWREYKTLWQSDKGSLALIIGAMGSMANLLSHGLVDNSIYVSDLAIVFALLIGIISTTSPTQATSSLPT